MARGDRGWLGRNASHQSGRTLHAFDAPMRGFSPSRMPGGNSARHCRLRSRIGVKAPLAPSELALSAKLSLACLGCSPALSPVPRGLGALASIGAPQAASIFPRCRLVGLLLSSLRGRRLEKALGGAGIDATQTCQRRRCSEASLLSRAGPATARAGRSKCHRHFPEWHSAHW